MVVAIALTVAKSWVDKASWMPLTAFMKSFISVIRWACSTALTEIDWRWVTL